MSRLALAALLTVAGCRPDARRAAPPPIATDHVLLPPSYRFDPADITIPAGTAVTWRNGDNFTHSVRLLEDGGAILVVKPADSVAFTFATPGVHRYDCSFHPHDMKGTVTVTAEQ